MNETATAGYPASQFGQLLRFRVDAYHRMGEVGIIGPELRTELLDGKIVEMAPIGHPHAGTVKWLANYLINRLDDRVLVSVQDPIRLNSYSEPLPDLALLRPRADFYRHAHPEPKDVLCLIEVADSSLAYDRDVKLPGYALAEIPEVWLVDLTARTLWRYREPESGAYRQVEPVTDLHAMVLPVAGEPVVDLQPLFETG